MPMRSQQQRKYLWATDPKLAREFEDETPKGVKLPKRVGAEKSRKKQAFLSGFWSELTKAADGEATLQRIMAQLEREQISRAYDLHSNAPGDHSMTMGEMPDMVPTSDAKSTTRLKLEIIRDPGLSDEDKNALLARLDKRPEISGSGATNFLQLGAAMPGAAQNAINSYLAAKRNPHAAGFLQRILRLGMLSSQAMAGGYHFNDPRRNPLGERPSQWKITPL